MGLSKAMYVIQNQGNVLIAYPTGSGKNKTLCCSCVYPISLLLASLSGTQKLADIMEAGKAFVGKNAKEIRTAKGKLEAYQSSDGLRRFRPPAKKSHDGGVIQANFEQRINDKVNWKGKASEGQRSNMHVLSDEVYQP